MSTDKQEIFSDILLQLAKWEKEKLESLGEKERNVACSKLDAFMRNNLPCMCLQVTNVEHHYEPSFGYSPLFPLSPVQHMLECKFTDGGELTIQSEMSHLEQVSVKMETLLEKLLGYVEKVVKGEIEGDRKIGRYLLEALSKVPTIAPEQFEALLNNNMQVGMYINIGTLFVIIL